jgi:hypothetical protein
MRDEQELKIPFQQEDTRFIVGGTAIPIFQSPVRPSFFDPSVALAPNLIPSSHEYVLPRSWVLLATDYVLEHLHPELPSAKYDRVEGENTALRDAVRIHCAKLGAELVAHGQRVDFEWIFAFFCL